MFEKKRETSRRESMRARSINHAASSPSLPHKCRRRGASPCSAPTSSPEPLPAKETGTSCVGARRGGLDLPLRRRRGRGRGRRGDGGEELRVLPDHPRRGAGVQEHGAGEKKSSEGENQNQRL